MKHRAYLGLGSNIGERKVLLDRSLRMLDDLQEIKVIKVSPFYETEPVGKKDQPWFLNAVCEIATDLEPIHLLHATQNVENKLGRIRQERWGPRTVDIDILLYDDIRLKLPDLIIPHPRIKERAFVLKPLFELNGEIVFPTGEGISEILNKLKYSESVLPWME